MSLAKVMGSCLVYTVFPSPAQGPPKLVTLEFTEVLRFSMVLSDPLVIQ